MLTTRENHCILLCLFVIIYWWPQGGHCKVYERCELARELKEAHGIPEDQISTWVCIVKHESEFNTSAVGHLNADGSGDHGLFQISDLFWCSPPGKGWACGVSCAELEDDDIKDDVVCAKRIYRQHQRISGNGFTAWAVYGTYCAGREAADKFVDGCYNEVNKTNALEETVARKEVVRTSKKFQTKNIWNSGI